MNRSNCNKYLYPMGASKKAAFKAIIYLNTYVPFCVLIESNPDNDNNESNYDARYWNDE